MKKLINIILIVIVLTIIIMLFVINCGKDGFWNVSMIQILTFLLASLASFYLVQKYTDDRRKTDRIAKILEEIQQVICYDEIFLSTNKSTLLQLGVIANKLKFLKEMNIVSIKDDLQYIVEKFENLRDLYSNHYKSEEELNIIKDDLEKCKANIDMKITKVILKLYN